MQRAKRAAHLFFRISDDLLPDIGRLLRGKVEFVSQTRLLAVSVLTGRERAVSLDELRFLSTLPVDRWTAIADLSVDATVLQRLALEGFVVCDDETGELAELRRRNDRLAESGWSPYAALYHSQSRWRDVDLGRLFDSSPAPPDARKPPPHFHALPQALGTVELPLLRREEGLFRLLSERKTTRNFDPAAMLTREELSVILYYTFGCHGFARLGDGLVLLKRTSPSGGSLHPIEVYPLVVSVEGVDAGFYHYRSDRHALDLIDPLDRDSAREQLVEFAAGQSYLSTAPLMLIMAARFSRSFWKYRGSSRNYAVLLMDAAHLSQTLYLVCAQLGLGAFVSAGVNDRNIGDRLRLDSFEEAVLAVCGCGRPARERSPFDAEFKPYVPRETVID
jgi:putative peptide maturation dehydrogenase